MATSGAQGALVDTELPAAAVLADATANPTAPAVGAFLQAFNGTTWNRVSTANGTADGSAGGPLLATAGWVWNGATWERPRTPNKFTVVNAANVGGGELTMWTPAAGKKFRLMGMAITVTGAGILSLRDNTAGATVFIINLSANVPFVTPPMGNGILSAAANNVLTAQLFVAGTLTGTFFGTEE